MTPPDTFYFSCVYYYTEIGWSFYMVKNHTLAFFDRHAFSGVSKCFIFYFNSTDVAACVLVENISMKM